ncbi:hypothetical protein QYS49_05560 [Marivirga salinae]|uniref:Tetratricopeptide repeat protein n=1 Tax=Marivirga salinarum TaxID=3059078 RepID=A0AA49GC23_9BACT|nr:hypothetical protein [Marivirga sp. BDSF4-3]WKK76748.1 hypothetical protein QYS49_05560 [Marivirga sp. BDSF4-3]
MNLNKKLFFILTGTALISCQQEDSPTEYSAPKTTAQLESIEKRQDSIIQEHLKEGAWKYSYYSPEWQEEIDKGLAKDSTIAYLWQQKAMPLFKQGKYEIGMPYLDKAVKYNRRQWQDYRAFMKCIFSKTYRAAIVDFKDYQKRFGSGHVMDHSYDFYIALSYLQLNEFHKAEILFKSIHETQLSKNGKEWLHPVELFYYGISKFEQAKYLEANELFDLALTLHDQFSDVQYYKAMCLSKMEKREEAKELMAIAEKNGKDGFSLNEDNAFYERYPYQVRWR